MKTKNLRQLVMGAALSFGMVGCGTTADMPTEQGDYTPTPIYDSNDNEIEQEALDEILDSTHKVNSTFVFRREGFDGEPRLHRRSGHGSGFAFDCRDGRTYILTAYHVVQPSEMFIQRNGEHINTVITLGEDNDDIMPAEYEFGDQENDVAVISVDNELETYGEFANPDELQLGDKVYGAGYPMNLGLVMTQGILIGKDWDDRFYMVDAHINPGNSGGAFFVFDEGQPQLLGLASVAGNNTQGIYGVSRTEHILDMLVDNGF